MNKKNTENPPDGLSFQELINHIWDHGLGNDLSSEGIPVPWTPESFEAAFFTIGFEVDPRSYQNWRQGIHKADRKNMHAIAKVVSAGDNELQRLWARALIQAPKVRPVKPDENEPKKKWTPQSIWETYHQFIVGVSVGLVPLFAVLIYTYVTARGHAFVTDLKFCDEDGFSQSAFKCHNPASHFPSGTKRIYVSFDFNNSYDGQPFERSWYQNSEKYMSNEGFNDSAWPGYTFIASEGGIKDAKYDLRIVIGNSVTTKSFVVGTFDPKNLHPDHDPS